MICIQVCQLRIVWIIWIRTNLFGLLPPHCLIHFTTFALQFSKCLSGPLKGHFPKLKIGPSNTPPRTSLGKQGRSPYSKYFSRRGRHKNVFYVRRAWYFYMNSGQSISWRSFSMMVKWANDGLLQVNLTIIEKLHRLQGNQTRERYNIEDGDYQRNLRNHPAIHPQINL